MSAVIADAITRLAQRYDNHDADVAASAVVQTLGELAGVVSNDALDACRNEALAAIEAEGPALARGHIGGLVEALEPGRTTNETADAPALAEDEEG